MEKNTVLLSLEQYNELRDFKKEIEKGNVLKIYYSYSGYDHNDFINIGDALKEISEVNNGLLKEKMALEQKLENKNDEIKKMSYWQFRKWKKSNKY